MQFTIVDKRTGETRLLTSTEGDTHAYLFESEAEAEEFASHLDDYLELTIRPLSDDQLAIWATGLKAVGATGIVREIPGNPLLSSALQIELFLLSLNWPSPPNGG